MRYEILEGTKVINTVEADAIFMGTYFPEGNFREAPVELPLSKLISAVEFKARFTAAEKAAIEWASVDKSDQSTDLRMGSAAIRSFMKSLEEGLPVNLEDSATIYVIGQMVVHLAFTENRSKELLQC